MTQSINRRIFTTTVAAASIFSAVVTPLATPTPAVAQDAVSATADDSVVTAEYHDGAKIEVTKNVDSLGTFRIKGTGWKANFEGPSVSTIKLKYQTEDGKKGTYTRSGDKIISHPVNKNPEPTIWAYFWAENDGTFDKELDLPELEAGQMLRVNATSSLGYASDVARTVTTPSLVVGGKPWEGKEDDVIECKTNLSKPQLNVATKAEPGNKELHITGEGFCNPINGGMLVSFKIDDGKFNRLPGHEVNSNTTIWYMQEADPETGKLDFMMPLPDGTTSGKLGSNPAFKEGVHTIRALAGSMKDGDPVFTSPQPGSLDNRFVVGDYAPNEAPDPVNPSDDLTDAAKKNLTVKPQGKNWIVTVPQGKEGQFVYPTLFATDGRDEKVWEDKFFKLDKNKQFTIPAPATITPKHQFVVQSADFEDFQEILGWTYTDFKNPAPNNPGPNKPNPGTPASSEGSSGAGSWIGVIAAIAGIGGLLGGAYFWAKSQGFIR